MGKVDNVGDALMGNGLTKELTPVQYKEEKMDVAILQELPSSDAIRLQQEMVCNTFKTKTTSPI